VIRLIVIISALVPSTSWGNTYGPTERQTYIERILNALSTAPKQSAENIDQYMSLVADNKCQSVISSLSLKCLYEEAVRNCKSSGLASKNTCAIISDVILVNKSNEKQILTKEERFKISEH